MNVDEAKERGTESEDKKAKSPVVPPLILSPNEQEKLTLARLLEKRKKDPPGFPPLPPIGKTRSAATYRSAIVPTPPPLADQYSPRGSAIATERSHKRVFRTNRYRFFDAAASLPVNALYDPHSFAESLAESGFREKISKAFSDGHFSEALLFPEGSATSQRLLGSSAASPPGTATTRRRGGGGPTSFAAALQSVSKLEQATSIGELRRAAEDCVKVVAGAREARVFIVVYADGTMRNSLHRAIAGMQKAGAFYCLGTASKAKRLVFSFVGNNRGNDKFSLVTLDEEAKVVSRPSLSPFLRETDRSVIFF